MDDFFDDEVVITQKILNFGSLVCILYGKELSVVAFFNAILQDADLRECLCSYLDTDFLQVTREMGRRYDILGTSKKILKINEETD